MSQYVDLWLRGRFCRVWGWVERADRSVGIMAAGFCIERVEIRGEEIHGVEMFHWGNNPEDTHLEDLVLEDLYTNEATCIEEAFWNQASAFELNMPTYSWWRVCK